MYLPYVNIKMGTDSVMRYSRGNTLPLTQLPFAMASFCPQTERLKGQESWFYKPSAPYLEGIRLTHQPSPWIDDYGTLLLTPQNDVIASKPDMASSSFRLSDSVLAPHYLKVHFLRSNCIFELSPTEYGGAVRLSFLDKRKSYLSILPILGDYTYELDKEKCVLFGTTNGQSKSKAKDFKMYFAIKIPQDVVDFDSTYEKNGAMHIALNCQTVDLQIGISYISYQMALESIERDLMGKSFDEIKTQGAAIWEERLSRIEIDTDDEAQKRTFYSCLYRCFLFPHKAHEINKDGTRVHYSACDGTVKEGALYTDTGFWDTSRTEFPLLALIAKEEYAEMLEGFVNIYKESGYLPRWHSLDEVGCMPSTLIDPVILDAVYNGIGNRELWEAALDGMIHHANVKGNESRFGRNGVEEYLKYGYVPCDLYKESVNLTLDAAYGDWCIAEVARRLGKDELCDTYMARSKNYKHLFCTETGFMRGKDTEGKFAPNFDPTSWGGNYTEGSAYQNSHFVPHDIEGLCELYGGRDKLLEKIDEIFNTPPTFRVFGYGGEIHEMSEMAQVDFGQCAISNQPSFHIPYIYAYLGETGKAEYWIHKMCKELFSSEMGYPGDEDNGSMSAWYILSTLGMYPLCAGREMVKIKPLVKSAKILNKKLF